jgi:3-methylcrotonyl-CoA carboxylase alpha subunit
VQRRHQKIIEEAPSPSLSPELRRDIAAAAVSLVSHVGYRGAGTVEFLLQDGHFYFMEVNTRLQVEHPVTEMVMGVDLVKAQLLTAQGKPLLFDQKQLLPRGHSIECRLYAENPFQGGVPSTGELGLIEWPEGFGRRYEFGFEEGDEVTPYYDSMIAKIIVWDETRERAIQKMLKVLSESVVFGVHTNIPLLAKIIAHKEFVEGTMTTRFFETHFSQDLKAPVMEADTQLFAEQSLRRLPGVGGKEELTVTSPWSGYWRGV